MAASESDFTGVSETSGGGDVKDQWPKLARAIQSLVPFFLGKVSSGTEPTDVLTGVAFGNDGQAANHLDWRIFNNSSDEIVIQENTGTEGTPVWTTRVTIDSTGISGGGGGVSDHGALTGLNDDDHTQYALVAGTRDFTGTVTIDNGADSAFNALQLEGGSAAEQDVDLDFNDRAGTTQWTLRKDSSGDFAVRDASTARITVDANGIGVEGSPVSGRALNVVGKAVSDTLDTDSANEWSNAQGSTESTPSSSAGTLTLDFSASNLFEVTLTENVTTLTINNTTIPGYRTLILTQDSTPRTFAWAAGIQWEGGTAPTITASASAVDIYTFLVSSGGTIYGFEGGQDFS